MPFLMKSKIVKYVTQELSFKCHYIGTNEMLEEGGLIIEERCMVVTIHKDV